MANYKTGAQRRNDRMEKIFDTAYELAARKAGWNNGDKAWSNIPNPENYWGKDGVTEPAGNVRAYLTARECCLGEDLLASK